MPLPNPFTLTETDKANAIVVDSLDASERVPVYGSSKSLLRKHSTPATNYRVYKLRDCDATDPDQHCYFVVGAEVTDIDYQNGDLAAPASRGFGGGFEAEYKCYIALDPNGGQLLNYRLQQNVGVKHFNKAGGQSRLPAKTLYENMNGTFATVPFYWSDFQGPSVSPVAGEKVKNGELSVTSSAVINGSPGGFVQRYFSVNLFINTSGWGCR